MNKKELGSGAFAFFNSGEGEVVEIRALGVIGKGPCWEGWAKGTVSGYFDDPDEFAKAANALDSLKRAEGIYGTLNPVDPALLARANNRLVVPKATTTDEQIVCQRRFLIDTDPKRPSGISATNAELEKAINCREEIAAFLHKNNWPDPIKAHSGNGGHLVYRLPDLPNNPETAELKKLDLQALNQKFGGNGVDIDRTVFNASRICKLYGTWARKGDSMENRPHRRSYLEVIPDPITPVTLEQLEWLASLAPKEEKPVHTRNFSSNSGKLDVEAYLSHYGIEISKVKSENTKTIYGLRHCIFDPGHTPNEAAIIQDASGLVTYQCFHNSCQDRTWAGARERISGSDSLAQFCNGYGIHQGETYMNKRSLSFTPEGPPDEASELYGGCSDTDESVEGLSPKRNILKETKIECISFAEIENLEFPDNPTIDGLLDEKESLIISGASGEGKSALTNVITLALGNPSASELFGLFPIPKPIKSLIVQSENSMKATNRRLKMLNSSYPEMRAGAKNVFSFKVNNDCRLIGNFEDKEFQKILIDSLLELGARLLVIDPLISYHTRDENDNGGMRHALDEVSLICEKANSAVIICHHYNRQNLTRGAAAIRDWTDNMLLMDFERWGHDGSRIIKITHDKSRNYKQQPDFYLERTPDLNFLRCEKPDSKQSKQIEAVVAALTEMGGNINSQAHLKKAVMVELNCSEATSRRAINEALEMRKIIIIPGEGKAYSYALSE